MSRYEHEYGTINFTKTGYMSFVRALRSAYNDFINELYQASLDIHTVLAAQTGSGKLQRQRDMFAEYTSEDRNLNNVLKNGAPRFSISTNLWLHIKNELFRGEGGSLCKPRQSAFATLTNKQVAFNLPHCDEFTIALSDKYYTLSWNVRRNNHAVRDARAHPIADLMFSVLSDYKWKRGEGGVFWYTDEYSESADEENDENHSMEISGVYGPVGQAKEDDEHGVMRKSFRRPTRAHSR